MYKETHKVVVCCECVSYSIQLTNMRVSGTANLKDMSPWCVSQLGVLLVLS